MIGFVVGLIDVAGKAVAAGNELLIFREIFGTHDRVTAQFHILFAVDLLRSLGRPFGAGLVVEGRDEFPGVFDFAGRLVHVADGLHHLAHPLFDQLGDLGIVASAVALDMLSINWPAVV